MQSAFFTHIVFKLLTPDILFVAGAFSLAALILFALALEAGTYPEVEQSFRRLRKTLDRLGSNAFHRDNCSGQEKLAR